MVQNIRFEDWETEQMRDPEFRAAVEELEPEYQEERRRMTSQLTITLLNRVGELEQQVMLLRTASNLDVVAIRKLRQRVTKQGERIEGLWDTVIEHAEHIEKLETCAVINAETIGQVELLKVAMVEQGMRIERLETAIVEQHDRIGRLEATINAWIMAGNHTTTTPPLVKVVFDSRPE